MPKASRENISAATAPTDGKARVVTVAKRRFSAQLWRGAAAIFVRLASARRRDGGTQQKRNAKRPSERPKDSADEVTVPRSAGRVIRTAFSFHFIFRAREGGGNEITPGVRGDSCIASGSSGPAHKCRPPCAGRNQSVCRDRRADPEGDLRTQRGDAEPRAFVR